MKPLNSFVPDGEFIVFETEHWRVNQRVDSPLPGYLIVGARYGSSLSNLSDGALVELGPILSAASTVLEELLDPEHVHVCRFGHEPGHSVHFHVIPICEWVTAAYFQAVADRKTGLVYPDFADGASLTLFASEEFSRGRSPCRVPGPGISDLIRQLRRAFVREATQRMSAPAGGQGFGMTQKSGGAS